MKVINQLKGIDVEDILKKTEAIMQGHFKLTSGYHSEYYIQCARLLQFPDKTDLLIGEFLKNHEKELSEMDIDTVISPAVGGILFGYHLAYRLNKKMIFTERKNNQMVLRRGFKVKKGERFLIAEDVVTTGGSVFEVIDVIRKNSADVTAVVSIIDRSSGVDFKLPYFSFIKIDIEKFEPDVCPMCKKDLDFDYLGSRK